MNRGKMKTVIVLGNSPSECSLEVDGKIIKNVSNIEAMVNMDHGPRLIYHTMVDSEEGPVEEVHEISFETITKE